VYVRRLDEGGEDIQLSRDGEEGNGYRRLSWAPDSSTVIAWRVEEAERKEVYLIRSSPEGGGRATLETRPYALPGDAFPRYELNLFDVATRAQTKPAVDRFEHEWLSPDPHWWPGTTRFAYTQDDRGHQRYRVIEVDIRDGSVRNLVDEHTDTFIWTTHMEGPGRLGLRIVSWLDDTREIVYASERDGWRHLYLVDADAGEIRHPITHGEWVVRGIDRIDEANRQIWFQASGMHPDQDPYLLHAYRIHFDGTGLTALTAGHGQHQVSYSPDEQYLIDTYSRVDLPPVTELRRVSDGALVCALEQADIAELEADGWEAPEVFTAKGRDGVTDIWGIIVRPRDLDPAGKYPIIEDIYAGPQDAFVPKTFSPSPRYRSLTDLGFVVVKIDGMGTANRSKAFHDVCFRNLKDGGFEDRMAWMRAAAERYPYLDVDRVGIYGTSAGGQNASAAVLHHPDFYKAAAANCGCHDNRMDKASWNEQWMGYMPGDKIWESSADNWYAQSSNIVHADKLRGAMLLCVGEVDTNVPPESTLRLVDALIRANKDFELLVVPNGGHGSGGAYYQRRMQDFFVRHLGGVQSSEL
jgi:dipeptidyl aminopeptidase/acylaminoacyl peptidase